MVRIQLLTLKLAPDHPTYSYGRRDDEWMKHTHYGIHQTTVLNTSQYVSSPLTVAAIPPKPRTF